MYGNRPRKQGFRLYQLIPLPRGIESPAQAGLPCFLQTAAEERAGTEPYLK